MLFCFLLFAALATLILKGKIVAPKFRPERVATAVGASCLFQSLNI